MRRMVAAIVVAASVTLLGQTDRSAQTQPAAQEPVQQPTFRTGVEVVSLDVAVTDSRGRPVTDLRAPDFVVRVDGKPRRIVSSQLVHIDVEAAKRQAAAPRVETFFTSNIVPVNGRMIVIAVDQTHIRPGAGRPILNTAAKFLDRLSPVDQVAFLAYPPPGPSVGFTTDRLRVRQAMTQVVGMQPHFEGQYNIGLSEAIAIHEEHDPRTFQLVAARECRVSSQVELEACAAEIESESAERVAFVRRETAASLNGLEALLRDLAFIEGPKTLILLSESLVVDERSAQLEDIARLAARGRVSVYVMLMDVPGVDVAQGLMPPSPIEDRRVETRGLEALAAVSRGALFQVIGSGEGIFERLASEISAYYLLGVEEIPGDRDGKRHRVEIEVRRRGLTLRSRSAFVVSTATAEAKPEEHLLSALKSPFGVAEIPMRLTHFTYQDPQSTKIQVYLAAEIGQAGAPPAEYTMGFVLFDDQGQVVASRSEKKTLTPLSGRDETPLGYTAGVLVEPGTYSIRLAAVDAQRRRGSVVRDIQAWKMADEEFAVGDLMVGTPPASGRSMEPQVEPYISDGTIAAYLELYAAAPDTLNEAAVTMEIADDEDAPALATASSRPLPGSRPTTRLAQAIFSTGNLPLGRYVVRAQIMRKGQPAGVLVRPFMLATAPARAGSMVPASLLASVPSFDRAVVLRPEVVASMLDLVERASPGLGDAMSQARSGRYGAAALEALTAGDQPAAMFMRGLDLFIKGQLDQAATQFNAASGPRREYFPAAFYLGACYATAGRDEDAAGIWQLAMGAQPRPALVYALFADARLRAGQPASAAEVLRTARERSPKDDDIAKRLALAYLMTARYADAVPVLQDYLARHPSDQDALFSVVLAQYEATTRAGVKLSTADHARLTKYLRAYKGPQQALLAKYVSALTPR